MGGPRLMDADLHKKTEEENTWLLFLFVRCR